MNKIAIIIPSRLDAQRFPNKPLKLINNKEMILHVLEVAYKSNLGEVYVATPDQKIIDLIKKFGGNAIKTSNDHQTGTDRIFEVFKNTLNNKPDIIVNLQGDMPNLDPEIISKLVFYMKEKKCDIGTLASDFRTKNEITNPDVVKVAVKEKFNNNIFQNALDFFRLSDDPPHNLYHHIGIYAFTNKALEKYVNLKRSKLELDRKLEQLRALENNMSIHVGFVKTFPLSVDTEQDLNEVRKILEKK